jgi:hypothetical protein
MEHRTILRLLARDDSYKVIVEPWADEFSVTTHADCRIVALNPLTLPSFEVELYRGALIVYVHEGGSTYEFWRDAVREFWNPIPIPF